MVGCNKIADAEAAVSVNEKKWLVMHMHVQLRLDELRGPRWWVLTFEMSENCSWTAHD
jgi:hypothetical protein